MSSKRDKEDEKRFFSSGSIDKALVLRYLKKHVHLSFRELSIVSSIVGKMKAWRGRIYCKVLYSLAGGKEAWLRLKKKLHCFLVILDEWQTKKCRQWGWSQRVLDGVSSMQLASKDVAVLLAGEEEVEGKKCVMAGVTLEIAISLHTCSSDLTNQHVLSYSQETYCQSNELRDN